MDGYVTKPVRRRELLSEIDRLIPIVNTAVPSATPAPAQARQSESLFDREKLLEEVEGNVDLLRRLAGLYLEGLPQQLERLRVGVRSGDASLVEKTAHTLKGSLAQFYAPGPGKLAYQLESLGHRHELDKAARTLIELEAGLADFAQQLQAWLKEL